MSSELPRIGQVAIPAEARVSKYDRVSAMLTALVIMLGSMVAIMFLIWLTGVIREAPIASRQTILDDALGEDEAPDGESDDIEEPGSEFPEVETPQLADSLEALTTAASSIQASDRAVDGSAQFMGRGTGLGTINGGGLGNGLLKPPWERWEIRYTTASQEDYGLQMDFFKIELGAISRDTADIVYLQNLAGQRRTRNGRKSAEKRVFFNYNQGVLSEWDKQFMEESGINLRNRILVQFYPPDIQTRLLALEKQRLGGKSLETVYRTVFGVRATGNGFEYYVIDQLYR